MGFWLALQFLSRLPPPVRRSPAPEELGRSMRWFPAVGALLGALVGIADIALAPVVAPEVRAIVAVVLLAALTGALHLDGLVDTCDGLFALASPERRLEIMSDSRVGSFGIVGAAAVLLLKYAAILALPGHARLAAFVAMGALSRWSMVYATVRYPVARQAGLAHAYKHGAGLPELAMATGIAIVAVAPLGLAGGGAFLLSWVIAVAIGHYSAARLNGLTGDVYGAISEVVEIGVAIVVPPLLRLQA